MKISKGMLLVAAMVAGDIAADMAMGGVASDSQGLDEIIVTAAKSGAMSAQAAPFTIQAIGEDEMTRGQIGGFDDYSNLIPGLATLNKGPDQTQILIRGITGGRVSHAEPQNQSTSGLYVDEMQVASNGFIPDLDLFDVNRIEVLKGPQGTLYGAGAMSGAIRIITNEVDLLKVSGTVSGTGATVDHGGASYAGHALINVPLIDDILGVRASAFYDHQGGFITNALTGQSDINGYTTSGARIKALWKVSEQFDVRTNVIYQHLIADGRPQVFRPGDPAVAAIAAPGEQINLTGTHGTAKFTPDPFDDKFILANVMAEYGVGSIKLVSSTSLLNRQYDK